jgi:hypothetical protein
MNIHLQWYGPYSVLEGTQLPYLFAPAVEPATSPGVYLWTIHYGGEELVHYVGKTEGKARTLGMRLWEEFGKRRPGFGWVPDPEKLQRGIKEWVYQPHGVKKPNMAAWMKNESFFEECWQRFLQMLRIFVAPMPLDQAHIKDTETALMWAVWDYEDATWGKDQTEYFLTNGPPIPTRLSYPYTIRMESPARFRGLGEAISDNRGSNC